MDLIIDANILFASLIRDGLTAELLFAEDLDIFAPRFLLEEMDKHRELLREKTHRTGAEFEEFEKILKRRIRIVPKEVLEGWLERAKRISPDPGDIPYFALALKLGCGIWSNDARLKDQKDVAVYSTKDILDMLG
jgi:predicted nucleic acid-binding protein